MNTIFAGCHDVREMKMIEEIDCPKCHARDGIEAFLKDGRTVGDSVCDLCGYVIEEGTSIAEIEKETKMGH